jgi:peptide/nickel transport system substrate-binding protein
VARGAALAALAVAALLAVSGAGGAAIQQTPKRGGTVVIASPTEPACLNWLRDCGGFLQTNIEEVLEGAFEIEPRRVRPSLVRSVDVTKGAKPPFTLTYHIRPEARWSDGITVSARDFVFTHRAIRTFVRPDTENPDLRYHRETVRSVRALGTKTVKVVLNARSASWKGLFLFVLPRHALEGEDLGSVWSDNIDNPKTGEPIASGPFLVERWERGKRLVLARNPAYWGRHTAYLDRVVQRFGVGDFAEALRQGELDVVHRRPDPETEPDFRRIPNVRSMYAPGRAWEHFEIRQGPGGHPALQRKLVRRALAYGIDRVAIVRAVYGDYLPRLRPSDSALFLTSSRYYEPNWGGYRYRPALARQLLEQAGCDRGADGIYACAGERLTLRFVTTAGAHRRRLALELAQAQLHRVGVEVEPLYVGGPSFFTQIVGPGRFDVALFTWFYVPEGVPSDIFACGRPQNFTGYCQRLVTRDLDQAQRILVHARRARVLDRADGQLAKDVPVIPLWVEPAAATVDSALRGFVPTFPLLAWNAENWWLAD